MRVGELAHLLVPRKKLELERLATLCGCSGSGKKVDVASAIDLAVGRYASLKRDAKIVSLDLGLSNIGFCQIQLADSNPPIVQNWSLMKLDNTALVYPSFAETAIEFAKTIAKASPDLILIERQRSRSAGAASLPHAIVQINVLEGMVHTALRCMFPQTLLQSVEPKAVLRYWRMQLDLPKSSTYRQSKQVRLDLVKSWLDEPAAAPISFDPKLNVNFKGKRDDLYDSLTQAVTWSLWRKHALLLRSEVHN